MPIYEFKCLKCGGIVELLFKSSEEQLEMKCPSCHSVNLERVMSATNLSISGNKESSEATSRTHNCGSDSCTTYNIPGHSR